MWFVDIGLALVVLILALLLIDALGGPAPAQSAAKPPIAVPAKSSAERDVAMPDRTLFQEINGRPVFLSSRRPPKPVPPKPPRPISPTLVAKPRPATLPPVPELDGVILSPEGAVALLRVPSAEHSVAAVVAQIVGGWKLVAVGADEVTLEAFSTVRTVKLNHARDNGKPSSMPRGQLIGRPANGR